MNKDTTAPDAHEKLVDACIRLDGLLKEAINHLRDSKQFGVASLYEIARAQVKPLWIDEVKP